MVDIYEYLDYRKLLKALYEERKKENRRFSHRFIGQMVGFSSPGYFLKVIQGKLNLPHDKLLALAKLFRLRKAELRYLELLVNLAHARTDEDKSYWFHQVLAARRGKVKVLTEEQYKLFSRWYYVAIYEMLRYNVTERDSDQLASMLEPPITPARARDAVEVLVKLGLVTEAPNGILEKTDANVSTGEEWAAMAVRAFQKETTRLAARALQKTPKERRDISTITVALSEQSLDIVRDKLRFVRREILELSQADDAADCVYNLNLQLFPVTRKQERVES